MKNLKNLPIILVMLCCVPVASLFAQGPPPPPLAVPFDGGLSLLAGAGIIVGLKKIWDARKN